MSAPQSKDPPGCFSAAHGCNSVGTVSPPDVRGDLGRDRGLEHRRLDVQRRIRLAHDEPRPGPVHRLDGAGRQQSADVSVRDSGGRARGHRRSAPIFDRRRVGRSRSPRPRSPRSSGCISSRRQPAGVQLHRDRGFGRHGPGVAGGRAAARAEARLPAAVAANSVGINVSRAVGPALGGLARRGAWNCGAVLGQCGQQRRRHRGADAVASAEEERRALCRRKRFGSADAHGSSARAIQPAPQRDSDHARPAFFVFASAYWALLPLVARNQIAGGPRCTVCCSAPSGPRRWAVHSCCDGSGRNWARPARRGRDARHRDGDGAVCARRTIPSRRIAASLIAGASWIAAVSSLNVSAQVALPEWVRGRGLAVYVTVMFGSLTLGSAIWGELAAVAACRRSAARSRRRDHRDPGSRGAGSCRRARAVDFSPSMHWPAPITTRAIEPDRGRFW